MYTYLYTINKVVTNINMDNKDHIELSCDTLGTTVPEAWQNLQMSSLTKDSVECVNEKVLHYNNCEDSLEHVQSSEYVNYYDNERYVLEQLKTEFPEDVLPQSDCNLNTQIHSENMELLKFISNAELNKEYTNNGLSLNIKEENDYDDYQFIVKTEGLEEQEDVQCKFYHNTLNNSCNLLQRSNKHFKVEINTPEDNGITELHQCQYCGMGFDNYNNMLVHISNDHKQEKSKCDICGKQFKSVAILNRHILAFHKVDKPIESRSPRYLRQHERLIHKGDVQNPSNGKFQCDECKTFFKLKRLLFDHIKALHFDYGRQFACWCGKQFRSPQYLRKHERRVHRRNVQNTNNDKFQCDSCKKTFSTKGNLVRHVKNMHYDYGIKFVCWCGKEFGLPRYLRRHERLIHKGNLENSNNGKFQCDYCKAFFKVRRNLFEHIKALHFDYGKRFACWCGKQFRSPLHLRKHERRIHRRNVENTNNDNFLYKYKLR